MKMYKNEFQIYDIIINPVIMKLNFFLKLMKYARWIFFHVNIVNNKQWTKTCCGPKEKNGLILSQSKQHCKKLKGKKNFHSMNHQSYHTCLLDNGKFFFKLRNYLIGCSLKCARRWFIEISSNFIYSAAMEISGRTCFSSCIATPNEK